MLCWSLINNLSGRKVIIKYLELISQPSNRSFWPAYKCLHFISRAERIFVMGDQFLVVSNALYALATL